MSNLEQMVWTRGRIAYDLVGHKQYPVDKALCRKAKQRANSWWY
jgi:hypothetical protein